MLKSGQVIPFSYWPFWQGIWDSCRCFGPGARGVLPGQLRVQDPICWGGAFRPLAARQGPRVMKIPPPHPGAGKAAAPGCTYERGLS